MVRQVVLTVLLAFASTIHGQPLPLGSWGVHVPYQSAVDVAVAGNQVWGALEASLIRVDRDDGAITRYTKATGLSDVEMAAIGYDYETGALVVAYANANIDIIRTNKVRNIPFLKDALITGDKTVNRIFIHDGEAWLACGFGIVRIDIEREEISDTYFIGQGNSNLRVDDLWVNDEYVFAATQDGIIRGTISPFVNLSNADDPNAWLRYTLEEHSLPEDEFSAVDMLSGTIYAFLGEEVFSLPEGSDTWAGMTIPGGWQTIATAPGNGRLQLLQQMLDNDEVTDAVIATFNGTEFEYSKDNGQMVRPVNLSVAPDGDIWYADLFMGLTLARDGTHSRFVPNGPYKRTVLGMTWHNGSMYVASSSLNTSLPASYPFVPYGFYRSTGQQWTNYNEYNIPALAGFPDIAVIEAIAMENKLLIGAHYSGILEFDLEDNSLVTFDKPPGETDNYRTIAMAGDPSGNIWMTNAFAGEVPLICRRPGGEYLYFSAQTAALLNRPLNAIAVDLQGQLWIATAGYGVYVYNHNGTLYDESDDQLQFVGENLNLPSSNVRCVTAELDGEIWIGTTAGIGVVFCPRAILSGNCQVDRICVPRGDTTNFCDNLLENEVVNCIATDPANRKWIGTNSGIFLQSSDGLETIHHFTVDNSPLLSDIIRSIAVNPENGDVFIGTEKGINTFRSDATLTQTEGKEAPYVYPNPVRPGYEGPIAIRNLPNNASVKIVDVAGYMVYETRSEGGQATWDGRDVNGRKVHSGVYIVMSADDSGKFTRTAKFVYIR